MLWYSIYSLRYAAKGTYNIKNLVFIKEQLRLNPQRAILLKNYEMSSSCGGLPVDPSPKPDKNHCCVLWCIILCCSDLLKKKQALKMCVLSTYCTDLSIWMCSRCSWTWKGKNKKTFASCKTHMPWFRRNVSITRLQHLVFIYRLYSWLQ